MLVIVASTNPVKTEAVKSAFERMFTTEEILIDTAVVPSGVADQPRTDEETLHGARNRALAARNLLPNAEYWVGIEGGIDIQEREVTAFAWTVVLSSSQEGKSRTSTFNLPPVLCGLIQKGKTLSEAADLVFARQHSGMAEGTVGLFTDSAITRKGYHEEAVILALIPHKNKEMYV